MRDRICFAPELRRGSRTWRLVRGRILRLTLKLMPRGPGIDPPTEKTMNGADKYDVLILGSGTGGKWMATTMAQEGMRTAVVERTYIGGSCVNIACLPSKNVIHTAKVASLVRRHQEFGIQTGPTAVNMSGVYARKRKVVDEIVQVHLGRYESAGDELIFGEGRFV